MPKYQPPRGTRDILPDEMVYLRRVIERLREVYESYGYGELHTPAFESYELLAAKSGDAVKDEIYFFEDKGGRQLGLRFEFTASLGRVIENNRDLPMPFKRWQIGNVWRYDRPAHGRYREFIQADVDVIGSSSMRCEAEAFCVIRDVLQSFGLKDFRIKLNHRKVLLAQVLAASVPQEKVPDALRAIDKLDKIGREGVQKEFAERGLTDAMLDAFFTQLAVDDAGQALPNAEAIAHLEKTLPLDTDAGAKQGFDELRELLAIVDGLGFGEHVKLDPTLVRGLDYYTGPVYEVQATSGGMMLSFAGGGRYDGLIKAFGGPDLPATGFAFGVDRLASVLKELAGAGGQAPRVTDVQILSAPGSTDVDAFALADTLRRDGIRVGVDLTGKNLGKQIKQANRLNVPAIVIVGDAYATGTGQVDVKDMATGEQVSVAVAALPAHLRKLLG